MSYVLPIPAPPSKQLPDPAQKLSSKFIQANGKPAGLWTPSKLALAVADFSGNRNFGTLNGGVTVGSSNWGLFSSAWKITAGFGNSLKFLPPAITGSFTASVAFMSPTAIVANTELFTSRPDHDATFDIQISSTGLHGDVGDGTSWINTSLNASYTLNPNVVYLVTYSISPTECRIYINGTKLATISYSSSTPMLCNGSNGIYIGHMAEYFGGYIYFCGLWTKVLSDVQVASLYQSLLTGEPYPLFAASASERFMANVTGGGATTASGAGGLLASSSLVASSLFAAASGITTTLQTVASSLRAASAGVQAAASQTVHTNLARGSASVQAAALETVLSNLIQAAGNVHGSSIEAVLTNLLHLSANISGSSAQIASSIISLLAQIRGLSSQTTEIIAQGLAGISSTATEEVLTNLLAIQNHLTAAASHIANSIFNSQGHLTGVSSAVVMYNLLSVAEFVEALATELASSLEQLRAGSGASASVSVLSNLLSLTEHIGAHATVVALGSKLLLFQRRRLDLL